jgi:hypothetical protein
VSLATFWAGIQGFVGTPRAQNQIINAFNSSPTNSRAGFSVARDGDIHLRQGGGNPDVGDYVGSGLPDANIGTLYEVRTIQTSGDTLTFNAGLNVFLPISSTRQWEFSDSPGEFRSFGGNYEIREIADTSNTSGVKSVTLNTEDGS